MSVATLTRHPVQPSTGIRWPLERVLFALAGSLTLLSAALAALVSPWFLLLTGLIGVNQLLFVLVGDCPASLILRRLFSLQSVVYPAPAPLEIPPSPARSERSGSGSTIATGPISHPSN